MKKALLLVSVLAAAAIAFLLSISSSSSRGGQAQQASAAENSMDSTGVTELEPVGTRQARNGTVRQAGRGFFDLPPGRRYEHRFSATQNSEMSFGEPPQEIAMESTITGKLEVLVVAAEDERLALQLDLSEVQVEMAATGAEYTPEQLRQQAGAYETTGYVLMQRDGQTLGYRFPEDGIADGQLLARSLWTALHCIAPPEGQKTIEVEDVDTAGPFRARFDWANLEGPEATVRKTREPVAGADNEGSGGTAYGRGTGTLSMTLRWPTKMHVQESGSVDKEELDLVAAQSASYRFELAASGDISTARLPELDLQGDWASPNGALAIAGSNTNRPRPTKHDLGTTTLEDLIAEVTALANAEEITRDLHDALISLAELFRRDPSQLDRFEELLLEGGIDPKAAMHLIGAVGRVESEVAQAFLAARIADGESPGLQAFALNSAMQLEKPNGELIDMVIRTAEGASDDQDLHGRSLMVLGALASRVTGADAVEFLLEEEERTEDIGSLLYWLASVGNSGAPATLDKVETYFSHELAEVRQAAAKAVRRIGTEEAVTLLSHASVKDESPAVRATAVEILAQRSTPEADAAFLYVLENEQDFLVREAAIRGLGLRTPRDDFALTTLTQLANSSDAQLSAIAKQALGE